MNKHLPAVEYALSVTHCEIWRLEWSNNYCEQSARSPRIVVAKSVKNLSWDEAAT